MHTYGSTPQHPQRSEADQHIKEHLAGWANKRNELPPYTMMGCTIAPLLVFIATNYIRSADIHYNDSVLSYFLVFGILLMVLATCLKPAFTSETDRQRRLFAFMLFSSTLACGLGYFFGNFNYHWYFRNYFDLNNLTIFPNTAVDDYKGQQFLDAGVIEFAEGTHIDTKAGFGFKNDRTYCVAPIVGAKPLAGPYANHDFWAVGLDCCSGHTGDFHCGEYNNPKARKGMRLLNDADRNYYRLAVESACAADSITANYPLFFHWMEHPEEEMNSMVKDGWGYFWREVMSFGMFQLFITVVALFAFI